MGILSNRGQNRRDIAPITAGHAKPRQRLAKGTAAQREPTSSSSVVRIRPHSE